MSRLKIVLSALAISLFVLYNMVFNMSDYDSNAINFIPKQKFEDSIITVPVIDRNYSNLIINTTGCKIPIVTLTKDLSHQHFKRVHPVRCVAWRSPLFTSNYTSVYMVESALVKYEISDKDSIRCCYMWLKRMTYQIDATLPDNSALYAHDCVFFDNSFNSPYEFIKVQCFAPIKYSKLNILLLLEEQEPFYTDFFYFVKPLQLRNTQKEAFNVLIVGLDSVSRINFHRQMPKTLQILQDLNAVEFLGFNKIADNTFPNVIAMLSGKSAKTIFRDCVQRKVFDECKFIWDYYKSQGYATAFIEDALDTGLFTFTYGSSQHGFIKQPTDYYWNHFYREADIAIGNTKIYGINYCFGSKKVHEVFMEYVNRFVTVMEESKQTYFGYFWQSILFHNDINQAHNGDDIYANLLSYLSKRDFLNNTVLLFMSDHGHRISTFRSTYEGMLEDRLPFLFVRLPTWLKLRYPHLQDNLKINTKRLITTFDIYETLLQLLNLTDKGVGLKRGLSLFSPIPENRTCKTAGIPAEFCMCQESELLSADNEVVVQIAKSMVSYINHKIVGQIAACANLSLIDIVYAKKSKTAELSSTAKGAIHEDYTVAFRTMPSKAVFEVTVRRTEHQSKMPSLYLTGQINRLNTYYNESLCVSGRFVKMYCFCVDLLK